MAGNSNCKKNTLSWYTVDIDIEKKERLNEIDNSGAALLFQICVPKILNSLMCPLMYFSVRKRIRMFLGQSNSTTALNI